VRDERNSAGVSRIAQTQRGNIQAENSLIKGRGGGKGEGKKTAGRSGGIVSVNFSARELVPHSDLFRNERECSLGRGGEQAWRGVEGGAEKRGPRLVSHRPNDGCRRLGQILGDGRRGGYGTTSRLTSLVPQSSLARGGGDAERVPLREW